jgi:hypothetical protein
LLRRCINEAGLSRNVKLFAGYGSRTWRRPDGFAVELWADRPEFGLVWHDSQRQPDPTHGVLNFYLGGYLVERLFETSTQIAGRKLVSILDQTLPARRPR